MPELRQSRFPDSAGHDKTAAQSHLIHDIRPTVTLIIPEPRRVLDVTMADGAVVRARQHGNPDGPRLMMSHGNGFAIDGYFAFWSRFLDGFEVVVFDVRSHGQNPLHTAENHDYAHFAEDFEELRLAVSKAWGEKPTAGLHHSVAALAALHHFAKHSWTWDALVLYDPRFVPPPGHPLREPVQACERFMSGIATKRRDHFDDPSELADFLRSARRLARWAPGSHDLMARAILREDPAGGWKLANPKEMEAAAYLSNVGSQLWDVLPTLAPYRDRLLILAGDPDQPWSQADSKVCPLLPDLFGIDCRIVSEADHLMQIERPEEIAALTIEFLGGLGIVGPADDPVNGPIDGTAAP